MTQNNNSNIIGDVAGAGFGILLLLGFTAGLYLADYQPESVSQSTASLLTGKNTNALKDLNRTADWSYGSRISDRVKTREDS